MRTQNAVRRGTSVRALCSVIGASLEIEFENVRYHAKALRKLGEALEDPFEGTAKILLSMLGGGFVTLPARWEVHRDLVVCAPTLISMRGGKPRILNVPSGWTHVGQLGEGATAIGFIEAFLLDAAAGNVDEDNEDLELGEIRLRSAFHEFSVGQNAIGQAVAGAEPSRIPLAFFGPPRPTAPLASRLFVERAIDLNRPAEIGRRIGDFARNS